MRIDKRVVLVTGGTRGIGLATALMLKCAGYAVVVCSRCGETVRHARELFGDDDVTECVVCDVSVREQVSVMFARIWERFGRLDVLVNNAAHLRTGWIQGGDEEEADAMMRTNFRGAVWCMQEAERLMGGRGLMVNVLATCLEGGRPGQGMYAASKAALSAASDSYVHELRAAGSRIAVIKVMPRRTLTDMRRQNFPMEDDRGCLLPEDVARAITSAVLGFEDAPFSSGTVIRVT
jgi:NAD(P)-dependent dehydrogenase (short-subunit alcohol dehydrogenase family)